MLAPISTSYVAWYLIYALVFSIFYLFSSPFISNRELRARWTFYVFLSTVLYLWLGAAVLFHLPLLTYDVQVPVSLFFPLFLATVVALLATELLLKTLNRYFVFHAGFTQNGRDVVQNSAVVSAFCCLVYSHCEPGIVLATALSAVGSTENGGGVGTSGGVPTSLDAAASRLQSLGESLTSQLPDELLCRALYTSASVTESNLPAIFVLWLTLLSIVLSNYALERLTGFRGIFSSGPQMGYRGVIFPRPRSPRRRRRRGVRRRRSLHNLRAAADDSVLGLDSGERRTALRRRRSRVRRGARHRRGARSVLIGTVTSIDGRLDRVEVSDDSDEALSPSSSSSSSSDDDISSSSDLVASTQRYSPVALGGEDEHLAMVPWYALVTTFTAVDVLISLNVFLGRFDQRNMQYAMMDRLSTPPEQPTMLRSIPRPLTTPRPRVRYFAHLSRRSELWMDWMADCGDGWNSSYQVARCMAQPKLRAKYSFPSVVTLPRADVFFCGGDLAYPTPSHEVFESRFFRPFECALPPPPEYNPNVPSLSKPAVDLDSYEGPQAFLIPGNHDWFDSIGVYTSKICRRDWLGGWLMPQEQSYFCVRLPHNWWFFGLDKSLTHDIDAMQLRYFAEIVEQCMDVDHNVILGCHEPDWVLDAFDDTETSVRIHHLMALLGPRCRVRLAGDIHNYTRHMPVVFNDGSARDKTSRQRSQSMVRSVQFVHQNGSGRVLAKTPSLPLRRGRSQGAAPDTPPIAFSFDDTVSRDDANMSADPQQSLEDLITETVQQELRASARALTDMPSWTVVQVQEWLRSLGLGAYHEAFAEMLVDGKLLMQLSDSDLASELGVDKVLHRKKILLEREHVLKQLGQQSRIALVDTDGSILGASSSPEADPLDEAFPPVESSPFTAQPEPPPLSDQPLEDAAPVDPPVLIVSGGGGAFLHPTHLPKGGLVRVGPERTPYFRVSCFPPEQVTRRLAWFNMFSFRHRNWRFDLFGGVIYWCLVLSLLPVCDLSSIINAPDSYTMVKEFALTVLVAIVELIDHSFVSLGCVLFCFLGAAAFAETHSIPKRIAIGVVMAVAHAVSAVSIVILMECAMEEARAHNILGPNAPTLYTTFLEAFPTARFSLDVLSSYTGGWSSFIFDSAMVVADIPSGLASLKEQYCAERVNMTVAYSVMLDGTSPLTSASVSVRTLSLPRLQVLLYYVGNFAYFWLLSTPVVSFVFGFYLFASVNFGNMHWNESFSSLLIEDWKNFLRMHIDSRGNLEIFTIGLPSVPRKWRKDPKWTGWQYQRELYARQRGRRRGADPPPSWKWPVPSYWSKEDGQVADVEVVDYVKIEPVRARM